MNQKDQSELSIIIVNWNTADLIDKCLKSIFKHTKNINFEVIIFDNASQDHLKQVLANYPTIKCIFNNENIGFARANNHAIKQAQGKYILLLNPDTELVENSLLQVLTFIKENSYQIIGVRLRLPDGRIQVSSGNFPSIKTMIFQNIYLFLNKIKLSFIIPFLSKISKVPISQLLQNEKLWDPYINHPVDWVSGAFFLIPKNDFIDTGKFREEFFFGGEEMDLCYRLAQEGKQAFFYGLTEIIHHSGASLKKFSQQSFILHHLAGLRLYIMNRPKWEVFVYRVTIISIFFLRFLFLRLKILFVYKRGNTALKTKIYAYQRVMSLYFRNQLSLKNTKY
jgi:GT2 family glycosyltransferase